jgi:hypothetical protein
VATSEVIGRSEAPTRVRDVRARLLVAVQLFVIGDYVLTALFSRQLEGTPVGRGELPGSFATGSGDPTGWLWLAGYYITILAGPVTALLAILGGAQLASRWPLRRTRTVAWLVGGTALCVAAFMLSLTEAGRDMASWTTH